MSKVDLLSKLEELEEACSVIKDFDSWKHLFGKIRKRIGPTDKTTVEKTPNKAKNKSNSKASTKASTESSERNASNENCHENGEEVVLKDSTNENVCEQEVEEPTTVNKKTNKSTKTIRNDDEDEDDDITGDVALSAMFETDAAILRENGFSAVEYVKISDINDAHLDDFRDMRLKDNNSILGSRDNDELIFAEGGSTIENLFFSRLVAMKCLLLKKTQYEQHRESILKMKFSKYMCNDLIDNNENTNNPYTPHGFRILIADNKVLKELLTCKTLGPCTILATAIKPPNLSFATISKAICGVAEPAMTALATATPTTNIPATIANVDISTEERSWSALYKGMSRVLVLDGLVNSENVGSIVRIAACFGIQGIVLSRDCCTCWSRRAIRVSMGHVFNVPIYHCNSKDNELELEDLISYYRNEQKFETFAAVVQDETRYLHDIKEINVDGTGGSVEDICKSSNDNNGKTMAERKKFLLVVGSEHFGICDSVRKRCETQLMIKMANGVDSLNVGVATAIMLHHLQNLCES